MRFGALIYIHGLWVVLLTALFFLWAFRRRATLLARFAHVQMLQRMMAHVSHKTQYVKAALMILALLFLVLALMEPKWGYTLEKVERRGNDVIVAVDVSKSMLAQDITPNRLDKAKRDILDLIQMMEGDRIGLIAFAGRAFVQCPLTLDYGACKMFVDDLEPQLIPVGGTHIGEAIRKAVDAFQGDIKNHRALILITDGEDHESDPIGAAELAKEQGIRIFCIGIGTQEGSPITITNPDGSTSYMKDEKGNVVLSKLDDETLKKIAVMTGGAYVPATTSGLELDLIYRDRIAKMDKRQLESTRKRRYTHRFQWPLSLAVICVIIDALTSDRKRRPRLQNQSTV